MILSDTGNFPTDLYIAEGVCATLGQGYRLQTVAPEDVEAAISDEIAVLMLTEVDYRTGRLHDMERSRDSAKAKGVVTVWDLAHSAGAFPVDLTGLPRRFRDRLRLQISERRSGRAGLHLRPAGFAARCGDRALGLDGTRGAVRVRSPLSARAID